MIKKFESFKEEPNINISYYSNGQKRRETWYLNNKYHRKDGPAYQNWDKDGQKEYEIWYLNGKEHREDGPCYQWNKNGKKEFEYWYLNDQGYSREEWIEELKKIGSKHYEEQKMLYDLEKYNL